MDAVRVAFAHVIDYAGLYPPASLPLDEVIERYTRYHAGPMSWMLGRLILPADRLSEATAAIAAASEPPLPASPWPVSVLVGRLEAAEAAVALAAATGSALSVASIEAVAVTRAVEATAIASAFPPGVERFIEIPIDPNPAPLLSAIAAAECLAKVRTGSTPADKFPSTESSRGSCRVPSRACR